MWYLNVVYLKSHLRNVIFNKNAWSFEYLPVLHLQSSNHGSKIFKNPRKFQKAKLVSSVGFGTNFNQLLSAWIALSPASSKFEISWESWGPSVHNWAQAALWAWLTFPLFTGSGCESTENRSIHISQQYFHSRHGSLLPPALLSGRFFLYQSTPPH